LGLGLAATRPKATEKALALGSQSGVALVTAMGNPRALGWELWLGAGSEAPREKRLEGLSVGLLARQWAERSALVWASNLEPGWAHP
jgi:hypothetical protein